MSVSVGRHQSSNWNHSTLLHANANPPGRRALPPDHSPLRRATGRTWLVLMPTARKRRRPNQVPPPAQFPCLPGQPILAFPRLSMRPDLLGSRLPQMDQRQTLTLAGRFQIARTQAPAPSRPFASSAAPKAPRTPARSPPETRASGPPAPPKPAEPAARVPCPSSPRPWRRSWIATCSRRPRHAATLSRLRGQT